MVHKDYCCAVLYLRRMQIKYIHFTFTLNRECLALHNRSTILELFFGVLIKLEISLLPVYAHAVTLLLLHRDAREVIFNR